MTATHSTGYRVLVVGFEKALVRYFSVFLKVFEYKVVDTALSVGETFRKAQANPPDILIVMALLPEMSGVDVGLRISRQSRCSVLFVAAMDGYPRFRTHAGAASPTRLRAHVSAAAIRKFRLAR